jgi:RNA polymerase sigma-70 factor (ECF subfamily)
MKTTLGFQAYRARRTQETLLALLREAQHRVYNLCYQVLRHPQDAEDAVQNVLVKLLDVLPRISEEEHFKSLLVRMSFQVSVDLIRSRQSRKVHEARKAMIPPKAGPSQAAETLVGLHLEISRLDADLRDLLVDRYFEGKSLALIASERRCSTASVWKGLERAKDKLRRAVTVAGLSALSGSMESSLEAMTYTPCPKDLVTPVLAAKAAMFAAAGSTPHLPLIGGMTMAAKSALGWVVAVIFVLALLGGVAVLEMRRGAAPEPPVSRLAKSTDPSPGHERPAALIGAALGPATSGAAERGENGTEPLLDHLRRFRELVRAANREGSDNRLVLVLNEESKSLRVRALADPREYLAFLRVPENEDILDELLNVVFRKYQHGLEDGKPFQDYGSGALSDPGKEIREGLQDLLSSGTSKQKLEVLRCFQSREDGKPNQAILERCVGLLSEERDPALLAEAIRKLHGGYPDGGSTELIVNHVDRIAAILGTCRTSLRAVDPGTQGGTYELVVESLTALNNAMNVKTHQVLLNTMEGVVQGKEYQALDILAQTLPYYYSVESKDADRWSALLTGELEASTDPKIFMNLVKMCATLPLPTADTVLEHAIPLAPTTPIREGMLAALTRIRAGDRNSMHILAALDAMGK